MASAQPSESRPEAVSALDLSWESLGGWVPYRKQGYLQEVERP